MQNHRPVTSAEIHNTATTTSLIHVNTMWDILTIAKCNWGSDTNHTFAILLQIKPATESVQACKIQLHT